MLWARVVDARGLLGDLLGAGPEVCRDRSPVLNALFNRAEGAAPRDQLSGRFPRPGGSGRCAVTEQQAARILETLTDDERQAAEEFIAERHAAPARRAAEARHSPGGGARRGGRLRGTPLAR